MDLDAYFNAELDEHEAVVAVTRALKADFIRLAEVSETAIKAGNKLVFFGNGGSAGDAQHLATELVCRYKVNRRALPAIAFTTDTSLLTATANDFGYEKIFSRQVEALCNQGDVAIGITTSGESSNVTRALETAREMGVMPAALTGKNGGNLVGLADPILIVPSEKTARIQEMHILLGQMLCDVLEQSCT
ncbi:MAG: Phosphoheptose isomerase 1 [Alphaproteobacteria bacterium MarineAlpha11_Bin1]|nr:MAG: Phosphoheptose isomerase 1 [Alphaproteobacteria bacterium MarineAlpha11_Bin1]|tara:strand:- start:1534 stop:2103 length:570 start_codon:yes stop_codon:yes gene_type:complete